MSSSPPSSSSSNINLSLSPVSLWEGGSHLGLQECDCDGGALILIVLIILIIVVNMMITIITGNALQENAELSSGQFIRPIISFISHLTSADSNNRCLSPIFSVYLLLHLRRAGGHLGGIWPMAPSVTLCLSLHPTQLLQQPSTNLVQNVGGTICYTLPVCRREVALYASWILCTAVCWLAGGELWRPITTLTPYIGSEMAPLNSYLPLKDMCWKYYAIVRFRADHEWVL